MPTSTSLPALRVRVARAHRRGDPDQIAEARRDLAAENLAAYVSRIIDEAPPLTDDQVARVVTLLRSPAPPGAATPSASGGTRSTEAQRQTIPSRGDAA